MLRAIGASGAVIGSASLVSAHGNDTAHATSELAAVRKATKKYQKVETAEADGYVTDGHCVAGPPGHGAMGIHYANFLDENGAPTGLDASVDPLDPEALVYEEKNGNMNLVAVEYIATEEFELFGQHSHPGPGPFYSLHAWVWRGNPNGVFAHFNPTVKCPPEPE